MMSPVLNKALPVTPWLDPAAWRLPGLQPLGEAPWLCRTDAFAGQMALRDALIATRAPLVHDLRDAARDAADECLELVLATVSRDAGYRIGREAATRPDGVTVEIDRDRPLLTAGRLVQEDICLMIDGGGGEHALQGAILCFPAGWTLAEKIGRPLTAIHGPVEDYDDMLARRVQRVFDAIHVTRPMWRANALRYDDPALFAPRTEAQRKRPVSAAPPYIRSERQTLRRLGRTRAVVFTILTSVVEMAALPPEARAALPGAGLASA